jgi:hypothetical protein
MDANAAFELVRTLGVLASMVSAYIAIRRERRQLNDRDREQILEAGLPQNIRVSPDDIKLVQVLPKGIGEAANDRIQRILRQYEKTIRRPSGTSDVDRETEQTEFEICHTLNLIKKHNRGKLPKKQWRDWWDAFNCDAKESLF